MLRSRDDMANGFGLKSKDRNSRLTNKREEKKNYVKSKKKERTKDRKIESRIGRQTDI